MKRVFKHVLYLIESIIITFDFEEINVLIEEPFNLAGECKKTMKCYNIMVFTVTSRNCQVIIARFYEFLFTLG